MGITSEVHETLVEALEPLAGERLLDVATGTGAVALRAAASGATVTGLDLSRIGAGRAGEGRGSRSRDDVRRRRDAEALPFADAAFDVTCSAIGTQFAPDHAAVARELARVTRPGGRLGLACWTPENGVAAMFAAMRPYMPPAPEGVGNIFDWGRPEHAESLLGDDFELRTSMRETVLHAPSGEELWELFVGAYGPTKTLAESLEPERRDELHRDFVAFFEGYRDGDEIVQARPYLLILGTRR